ncbi:glucose 1-dehydrogenase [Paraburkholderia sp. J41]|uniref:SDR family NAD(P)-dependent oxidoreductase n=1 Tax=Paraburkholderia sp. J41 TaxID=2805433 RepID=UPI002AC31504|nr:glucose 1-dehydrogenase [Paraburkholderia sp. J41]
MNLSQPTYQASILPRAPDFSLTHKRALVTGASRGIGVAAASSLCEYGADVTLVARSLDEAEIVADELRKRGGRARAAKLDVTDLANLPHALQAIVGDGEPFDILVNNAGTNRPAPFVDVTVDDFDAVMGLNVRSAFFVAQFVAAALIRSGRAGSIINMSSQMGHVGAPMRTVYCTSKHAVQGLTKAMAVELGHHGIRVNAICPTFIETPMTRDFLASDGFRLDVLSRIKLGRVATLEDVTGAVLYLASDASSMVTGSSLMVDGGWTAE